MSLWNYRENDEVFHLSILFLKIPLAKISQWGGSFNYKIIAINPKYMLQKIIYFTKYAFNNMRGKNWEENKKTGRVRTEMAGVFSVIVDPYHQKWLKNDDLYHKIKIIDLPVYDWFTTTIQVIKLCFCNWIIHVHCRNTQFSSFWQLIKAVNSSYTFFHYPCTTGKVYYCKLCGKGRYRSKNNNNNKRGNRPRGKESTEVWIT